jgi:glutathione S-transferase
MTVCHSAPSVGRGAVAPGGAAADWNIRLSSSILMFMGHYDYQKRLQAVWERGVEQYRNGIDRAESMFNDEERAFLASIGQNEQEFFDYAEDYCNGGEPTFGDVAAVADVRRAYFIEVQKGQKSSQQLAPDTLPAKPEKMHGIRWLPRIIKKSHAKLRGELHPSIMYGCGGDRAFLREHDIHPAEFLRVTWEHEGDDEAIARWVLQRIGQ